MEHSENNGTIFWPMIIIMIIFSYTIMNNVMLTFRNGIYNHINKAYMALLMGSLMGMIHYIIILWQGIMTREIWYGLAIWTVISIVFIILIRQQLLINDQEFLKGMIEHHDMAILVCNQIINKTRDRQLADFANQIIQTQQAEIKWMKRKL